MPKSKSKLYKVTVDDKGRRLIEANSKHSAIMHAVGDSITCELATHKEVAGMVKAGVVLETADGVGG